MRLGAQKNGASDVKSHAWFKNFDWDAFHKLDIQPPYMPKVEYEFSQLKSFQIVIPISKLFE